MNGGADRLEVCANLGVGGGTTPSIGLVRSIQKAVKDVPLMVSNSESRLSLVPQTDGLLDHGQAKSR